MSKKAEDPSEDEEVRALVLEGDGHVVANHRRIGAVAGWTELDDVTEAMRRSRIGGKAVQVSLRTLRPDGKRPLFGWRHRNPPVGPEHQVTSRHLDLVKGRYIADRVASMPEGTKRVWVDTMGISLTDKLLNGDRLAVGKRNKPETGHIQYSIEALRTLVGYGIFDSDSDAIENYGRLLAALDAYDELRKRRDYLENDVETRSFMAKVFLLGASAIRFVYRKTVGYPVMSLTTMLSSKRDQVISRESIRARRRFSFGTTTLILLFGAGYAMYRQHKASVPWTPSPDGAAIGADVLGGGGGSGGSSGQESAPPLPTSPDVDVGPPGPTAPEVPGAGGDGGSSPEGDISFTSDALTVQAGEGWIQQFEQMGLKYDPEFMNNGTGAWLERMGYAYLDYDPTTGGYDWRMNYSDIHPRVLDELYDRAVKAGLAMKYGLRK